MVVFDCAGERPGAEEAAWQPCLHLQPPTTPSSITCACWYPVDTGMFITGSQDAIVRVWDANAQQEAARLQALGAVAAIGMSSAAACQGSPLHTCLAVASSDHRIELMDLRIGASTGILAGHALSATCLTWSCATPWLLASGDAGGAAVLWDVRRGEQDAMVGTLDARPAETIPVSKPGRRLSSSKRAEVLAASLAAGRRAAGASAGMSTRRERDRATAHTNGVTGMAFVPCEKQPGQEVLATCGRDGAVRLWGWAWPVSTSRSPAAAVALPHISRYPLHCSGLPARHRSAFTPGILTFGKLPMPVSPQLDAGHRRIAAAVRGVALIHPNAADVDLQGGAGTGAATQGVSVVGLGSGRLLSDWAGHVGRVQRVAVRQATSEVFTGGADGSIVLHFATVLGGDTAKGAVGVGVAEAGDGGGLLDSSDSE